MLNKHITATIREITIFVNISTTTHGIKIILVVIPMFSGVENQIKVCQYWLHQYICIYESLEHSWFDSIFTQVTTVTVLHYVNSSSMLVLVVHFSVTTAKHCSWKVSFLASTTCEILALREKFFDRPESYDSWCVKRCVLLVHDLEYISPFSYTAWPKARYQHISKIFPHYSRTITNLTKFDFPLPLDQTWESRIWQMIIKKFKCGIFKDGLGEVRYL
jgi:hypothetical protein